MWAGSGKFSLDATFHGVQNKTLFLIFLRRIACLLFFAGLCISISACTGSQHRLPEVSDADLSLVNKEIAARRPVFKTIRRSDAANRALVTRVSNRLLGKARPLCDYTGYKSCFFQVTYKPSDTINAYAYDNNKIDVFRGLLQFLETEDEVAGVVAHEMGHHLANHNQEKLQNAMVGAAVSGILTAVVLGAANHNNPYYGVYQRQRDEQTVKDMTNFGAAMGALSYSREEEREADLLGQYLLTRAGYNLKRAERVMWLTMNMKASAGDNRQRSAFGDSHPAGPERIAAWRNGIAEVKANPTKLPYKVEKQKKATSPKVAKRDSSGEPAAPQSASSKKARAVTVKNEKGARECLFSWQTAKDGSRCGKRAISVKESKVNAFSE